MNKVTRREMMVSSAAGGAAIAFAGLMPGGAAAAGSETAGDHRLWYRLPAEVPREALVIGNGRLGAMVMGQPRDEVIALNEDSLWCGQPHDWRPPDGRGTLKEVRAAVFAGDYDRADKLSQKLQGPFSHSYAPMANLRLAFRHDGDVTDYRRALDLDAASATVDYTVGGVRYTRELFVSHPAQLIVVRLTADRAGALDVAISLDSRIRHQARAAGRGITLTGKAPTQCAPNYERVADPIVYSDVPGRGMTFATRLELLSLDGTCEVEGEGLRISNAREVVFAISAATGFRGFDRAPDLPLAEVLAAADRPLAAARGAKLAALRTAHEADHRALYRRLSLTLGRDTPSTASTDERLEANKGRPEPALAALYSNFSRYLLIASSRPGTQAANLQGIWSWEMRPPWSSNYTTNINLQQNYWGAEACNLAELHGPMIDYVEQVAQTGAHTARDLYGLEGWCVHHNSDLWRMSTPVGEGKGSPTWANFALAGPWLVRHVWEHYLHSGDREFLAKRGYPLLKGCAQFCAGWLTRDPRNGHMTTAPSVSTENSFTGPDGKRHNVSAGCTMDIAMIREVFTSTAEAAAILDVDVDFATWLTALAKQLPPYKIGKHGQLQEWELDFVEPEPEQRHISHLYPIAPGCEITPRSNPELARAARVSMLRRLEAGGAETGWGKAWAVHVFARLGDAELAHDNLNGLLKLSTTASLLDILPSGSGPLFQIDGNFAGGAAVIEMIVQSHDGAVAFLPALPTAWHDGTLRGVRARGGLELELEWTGGRMRRATVVATHGGTHAFRSPAGQRIVRVRDGRRSVAIERREGADRVRLAPQRRYTIDFA